MADQNNTPSRGWLPTLNAGQRFPGSTETENERSDVSVAEHNTPELGDRTRESLLEQDWPSALKEQFGLSTPAQTGIQNDTNDEVPAAEESVESLKERLAYYEHFDSLIRDNVSRSAALFQAVFTEREKARAERELPIRAIDEITAEVEARVHAERMHTRHILMSLMDEATYLQQRADNLIQHLAEAITEITAYDTADDEPVSGA